MIENRKKYKILDLTLLTIIAVAIEILSYALHFYLSGVAYHVSFAPLIALISIIRWGKVGAVVYAAAGIPMVFIQSGEILDKILLYPLANSFIVLSCLIFKFVRREEIRKDPLYICCYILAAYVSISIGKGFASLIISGVFLKTSLYYLISQLFNMIIVFIVFLIIRNKDGLLNNMDLYF